MSAADYQAEREAAERFDGATTWLRNRFWLGELTALAMNSGDTRPAEPIPTAQWKDENFFYLAIRYGQHNRVGKGALFVVTMDLARILGATGDEGRHSNAPLTGGGRHLPEQPGQTESGRGTPQFSPTTTDGAVQTEESSQDRHERWRARALELLRENPSRRSPWIAKKIAAEDPQRPDAETVRRQLRMTDLRAALKSPKATRLP
jgi:hypothetical protein